MGVLFFLFLFLSSTCTVTVAFECVNGPVYSTASYGLSFNITQPAQLCGIIHFLPFGSARSPVSLSTDSTSLSSTSTSTSLLDYELVVLNKRDRSLYPSGCSDNGAPIKLTPVKDDGQRFNNTVIVMPLGTCAPDFTGLNNAGVIFIVGGLQGSSTQYLIPVLVPVFVNDITLVYNYLVTQAEVQAQLLNVSSSSSSSSSFSSSNSSSSSASASASVSAVRARIAGTGALVDSERNALRAIANKLQYIQDDLQYVDTFYGINTSWLSAYPASMNYDPCIDDAFLGGIYCENGHVVLIDFAYDGIFGSFPVEFGQLTQVRSFLLSGNGISGDIVDDALCSWRSLMVLQIDSNNITSLPECEGVEEGGGAWINLRELQANNNAIQKLPAKILDAKKLTHLDVSANMISSFPSFSSLTSLIYLNLASNNAYGEIFSFQNMSFIQHINLHSNRFTGFLSPSSFDGLSSLLTVDLSVNQIHGPLPNFANTPKLTSISLDYNLFTGDVPSSWSLLSALTSVSVSHNQVTYGVNGTYPFLGAPVLSSLDLSYNGLPVPPVFFASLNGGFAALVQFMSGPSLTQLRLDGNKLTGQWTVGLITTTFFPLLNYLSMSQNTITSLPADLFSASSPPFIHLDVSDNALTGSIPVQSPFAFTTFLSFLHNPLLSGPLPPYLSLSQTSFHLSLGSVYVCPDVVAASSSSVLTAYLDPSYYAFQTCSCENGYYGTPPFCLMIPSMLFPNNSFSDSQFGNQRYSSGVDSSWLISVPGARSLTLNVTVFPLVFKSSLDLLNVYDGNSSTAPVVLALLGNELQTSSSTPSSSPLFLSSSSASSLAAAATASSISLSITVLNSVALVRFRSKDTSGEHFTVSYTHSATCPAGYDYDVTIMKCEQIVPIYSVSLSARTTVFVITALSCTFIIICLFLVYRHRNTLIIRTSAIPFCVLILFGLLTMSAGSALYAVQPTTSRGRTSSSSSEDVASGGGEHVCDARAWMTGISVVMVLASLLTKANRIRRIFNNDNLADMLSLSNNDLFKTVCCSLLIEILLLIVYSALPVSPAALKAGAGATNGYLVYQCDTDTTAFVPWIVAQLTYVCIFLIIGLYIAWSIRKVPTAYNESSHIVNCMHVLMTLGLVLVVVQFLISDPIALVIIRGLGQNLVSVSLCLTLFGPKFYIIFDGRGDDKGLTGLTSSLSGERKKKSKTTIRLHADRSSPESELSTHRSPAPPSLTAPNLHIVLEKKLSSSDCSPEIRSFIQDVLSQNRTNCPVSSVRDNFRSSPLVSPSSLSSSSSSSSSSSAAGSSSPAQSFRPHVPSSVLSTTQEHEIDDRKYGEGGGVQRAVVTRLHRDEVSG